MSICANSDVAVPKVWQTLVGKHGREHLYKVAECEMNWPSLHARESSVMTGNTMLGRTDVTSSSVLLVQSHSGSSSKKAKNK